MELNDLGYHVYKAFPKEEKIQTSLVVFFLVEGELTIQCQSETNRMSQRDILLINPGMGYKISSCRDALLGEAVYPIPFLTSVLGTGQLLFYCNSVKDVTHSYQPLHDIFLRMTSEYASGSHKTNCLQYGELFRLLDALVEGFQVLGNTEEAQEEDSDQRMRMMMAYILSHLDKEVSLNQLAADMYVSPSTLSRIFRKKTGVYFADYVTSLRVQLAMGMLEHTDQNMTRIAISCGFMNSASFNRAFRKVTGVTPSGYREKCRINALRDGQRQTEQEEQVRTTLREKGYLEQSGIHARKIDLDMAQTKDKHQALRKVWADVINIGPMWDLTNANVQYHIVYLSEQLHFKYVRVWNVFSKRMMISDGSLHAAYNYNLVDQALDFLVAHGLIPFIDFGRRPDTAVNSQDVSVFYEEQYIPFASRESWRNLVDDFLLHIAERYSQNIVSTWIFELSRDVTHGETLYKDQDFDYFDAFGYFYHCVRRRAPGASFGGIGDISVHDWNFILRQLQRCKEHSIYPDFISLGLFGRIMQELPDSSTDTNVNEAFLTTQEAELAAVMHMRQILDQADFPGMKLYVTEWNNTYSNRNYLNDSCYRAAYLVRKAALLAPHVDLIGIMGGTDWVSNYVDSVGVVNGGIGLLTRDMIRKPAFYAVEFLNRLGDKLLSQGDHYLATQDDKKDIYLLLFYYTWTRRDAYLGTAGLQLRQYGSMTFPDEQPIRLEIVIDNLQTPGEYILKRQSLNHENGSILDEWGKFDYDLRLGRDDVKYLQSISIPTLSMKRERVDAVNRRLQLDVTLQPDEISLIHIHCRK